MKKLLLLLAAGLFYLQTVAQSNRHGQPHNINNAQSGEHGKSISIHKRPFAKDTAAMNFKVCKSELGYAICGEAPGVQNTTYHGPIKPVKRPVYEANKTDVIELKGLPQIPIVQIPASTPGPESQSGAWFGSSSWNGIW